MEAVVLFMVLGAIIILRPITKRMGLLLEAMAAERKGSPKPATGDEAQMARLVGLMERVNDRMDLMEDRLEFMERLVEDRSSRRRRLQSGAGPRPVRSAGS